MLILMGFPALSGQLAAQSGMADPPAPMPREQEVTVMRGGQSVILLSAIGRSADNAKYLIRSQPTGGRLSDLATIRPGIAALVYTHGGGGQQYDEFTYAAQAPDSPVSAPARIRIRIDDPLPVFSFPSQVDFGDVLIGHGTVLEVALKNLGGGTIKGTATADAGWSIEGSPDYLLSQGIPVRLKLRFDPDEKRAYLGSLSFSHDKTQTIRLSGKGWEPLEVHPLSIEFQPCENGETDPAEIRFKNHSKDVSVLTIDADPGVKTPQLLQVAPSSEASMQVLALPSSPEGVAGNIRISHEKGEFSIPFRVFPSPGNVGFSPGKGLDFGELQTGQTALRKLSLTNTGGLKINLVIELPPLFFVNGPSTISLLPGESREVEIGLEPIEPNHIQATGTLRGSTQILPLPLTAKVSQSKSDSSSQSPNIQAVSPTISLQTEIGDEIVLPGPAFQELQLLEQTKKSLSIGWMDPTERAVASRLEERVIRIDPEGHVKIDWSPLATVRPSGTGEGKYQANLRRLSPGTRLFFRIVTLGANDQILAVSGPFSISTKSSMPGPHGSFGWVLVAVLIIAILGISFFGHKRRRDLLNEDLRNLRKLEEEK